MHKKKPFRPADNDLKALQTALIGMAMVVFIVTITTAGVLVGASVQQGTAFIENRNNQLQMLDRLEH